MGLESGSGVELSSANQILDRLTEACRSVLQDDIVLDPTVTVDEITVDVIHCSRFDSEKPSKTYVVTINTNDASMLRGSARGFKGSYKERIESVLQFLLRYIDEGAKAHVDIAGPDMPTVDRLIPIRRLMKSRHVSLNSPIVKAARRNGIELIQVRGRHLIAPSPAIAEFLEHYCSVHKQDTRNVLDLFAGSGVATKVLLRVGSPKKIVLIDSDPMKISGVRTHLDDPRVEVLQADALQFKIDRHYDLAIADPYYEDVENFLDAQLPSLREFVKVLVLVPGNVEDRVWNHQIETRLQHAGYEIVEHDSYGQVIYEARLNSRSSSR